MQTTTVGLQETNSISFRTEKYRFIEHQDICMIIIWYQREKSICIVIFSEQKNKQNCMNP